MIPAIPRYKGAIRKRREYQIDKMSKRSRRTTTELDEEQQKKQKSIEITTRGKRNKDGQQSSSKAEEGRERKQKQKKEEGKDYSHHQEGAMAEVPTSGSVADEKLDEKTLKEQTKQSSDSSDDETDLYRSIADLKNFEDTKPFAGTILVKVVEFKEKEQVTNKEGSGYEKMEVMCADQSDFLRIEIRHSAVIARMCEGKVLAFENLRYYKSMNKAIAFENTSTVAVVAKAMFKTLPRSQIPSLKSVSLLDHQKTLLKIVQALKKDDKDKRAYSLQGRIIKVFPVEHKTVGEAQTEVAVRNILLKDENDMACVAKLAFWREKTEWPFVEGQYARFTNLYTKNFYDGYKIINARVDSEFTVMEWEGEEIDMQAPSELISNAADVTEIKILLILSSSYFYPACPEKNCMSKSLTEEPKGTFTCEKCNGVWHNEFEIKQGIVLKVRAKVSGEKVMKNFRIFNESVQMLSATGPIKFSFLMDVEMIQSKLHELPLKVRGRIRPNKQKAGSSFNQNSEDVFTVTSLV